MTHAVSTVEGLWVLTGEHVRIHHSDGVITKVETLKPSTDRAYLTPGLVDLQVNGYAGIDINADNVEADDIRALVHHLWHEGITQFLPTIITGSHTRMIQSLQAINEACADATIRQTIPGIHFEGPFISPHDGARGAHPKQHVRPPDIDEVDDWLQQTEVPIKLVTLSPEWDNAPVFIEALVEREITVCIGHTQASSKDLNEAIAAGATVATHLGNGIAASINRHENPIWTLLARDDVTITVIADNRHVPRDMLTVMMRAKPASKRIIVSDTTAPAALAPGNYAFAGQEVTVSPEGHITLTDTPYLAGAGHPLALGIKTLVEQAGVSLPEAVTAATITPAQLIGQEAAALLAPGQPATFTIFDQLPSPSTSPTAVVCGKVIEPNLERG